MKNQRKLTKKQFRALPKIITHDHLDCSVRPQTLLELWEAVGFEQARLAFPEEIVAAWKAAGKSRRKRFSTGQVYQKHIAKHASASLKNYVEAIVWHVLPVMQTADNIYRITKERIKDAVADGVVAMKLRFAPQLHTQNGLSLEQVMDAVVKAVDEASIPVKLIVCALRHENADMAQKLADLAIQYKEHVCNFDLAADEHANSGILAWWLPAAMRVRQFGIEPTVHLWETEEPTAEDVRLLEEYGIIELGHGFRGDKQGKRICTICITSNVVTGQVASFAEHNADELFERNVLMTVDIDGTLFTLTDMTHEYWLYQRHFGWTLAHFGKCNLVALGQIPLSKRKSDEIRRRLRTAYGV
ncbi:MAG: hypothetical protein K2W82_17850 [Candidatus Obscuribacterales bacterium]|nr:hypothetical protein [Candidatus Obscuribacterales bacterium]